MFTQDPPLVNAVVRRPFEKRGRDGAWTFTGCRPMQPGRMDPHPWVVVVVRAWSENGRLRARLIRAGSAGDADVAVVASATDAAQRLHDWLDALSRPDDPSTPDAGA
jgi:hypothetical protein